jgi:hypothetical protein
VEIKPKQLHGPDRRSDYLRFIHQQANAMHGERALHVMQRFVIMIAETSEHLALCSCERRKRFVERVLLAVRLDRQKITGQ